MNLNDFKKSKFLTKEDAGTGILVTIAKITEENVAMEGAEPEYRPVVWLQETEKPFVCNMTNAQAIAAITGATDEIETKWVGAKIVLFNDPNVMMKGKLTGGLRVRAPKQVQPKEDLPF